MDDIYLKRWASRRSVLSLTTLADRPCACQAPPSIWPAVILLWLSARCPPACSARAIVRPAVHERECSDEEKKWVGAWCELGECAPAWQAWCCVPPAGEAGVNPPGAPP